ncbi:MAG: hypothetical protein Roseis2KO_39450 [Roseivirga sp.]
MRFINENRVCNVDVFKNGKDTVVRFYDQSREPVEKEIIDFVEVDPGFGYLSLKFRGKEALLSGFLDEDFFASQSSVETAIDFIKQLCPGAWNAYVPYHIRKMKYSDLIEYNGETT